MVNMVFFFLLPIAYCTSFLCRPFSCKKPENSDTSLYGRKITQKEIDSDESSGGESFNEYKKLMKTPSNLTSLFEKNFESSETLFNVQKYSSNRFDDANKELEEDARFVVNAMNESHESLCKLVSKLKCIDYLMYFPDPKMF